MKFVTGKVSLNNQNCHAAGKDTDMSAVFSPSKKTLKNIKPAAQKITELEEGMF